MLSLFRKKRWRFEGPQKAFFDSLFAQLPADLAFLKNGSDRGLYKGFRATPGARDSYVVFYLLDPKDPAIRRGVSFKLTGIMVKVDEKRNILVTVLCNEYPRFGACARVLSLADDPRFELYTSPLCLAIGAYFAEKKNGRKLARKKIALLAGKLAITTMNESVVRHTVTNPKVTDLEDGFQYYSSVDAKCTCIITYDKKDFHFAEIEVLDGEEFLLKYAVKKR